MVDVGQFDGVADADRSCVRLFLAGNHPEERGFPRAVGADDPDNAAGRQLKGHTIDQQLVAVPFGDIFGFNDQIAQARPRRDIQLARAGFALEIFPQQFLVGLDARLGFGMPAFGRHANPFQLALERFDAVAFGLFFVFQAVLLLLEP